MKYRGKKGASIGEIGNSIIVILPDENQSAAAVIAYGDVPRNTCFDLRHIIALLQLVPTIQQEAVTSNTAFI